MLAAEIVADDFDARFSATKRHYRYCIVARRADLALERNRVWRVSRQLDVAAMHEVAQRLVARPGSKEYGALTVNVAAVARAELLFGVPAGAFAPPPKVESAVVRITPLSEPLISPDEEHRFRVLVQSAFGMRRKQMRRVVRTLDSLDAEQADDVLARADIDPEVRPEVLTVEQFVGLLRAR